MSGPNGEQCETCLSFVAPTTNIVKGVCRRKSKVPIPVGVRNERVEIWFVQPEVDPKLDWCIEGYEKKK